MVRSEAGILARASRRAFFPASRVAAAFNSLARAFMAAFSSEVKPEFCPLVRLFALFAAFFEAVLAAGMSHHSFLYTAENKSWR